MLSGFSVTKTGGGDIFFYNILQIEAHDQEMGDLRIIFFLVWGDSVKVAVSQGGEALITRPQTWLPWGYSAALSLNRLYIYNFWCFEKRKNGFHHSSKCFLCILCNQNLMNFLEPSIYLENAISSRQEVMSLPAIFLNQKYSFNRRNDFLQAPLGTLWGSEIFDKCFRLDMP